MQSHPYSCLTCSLAFVSSTAQRAHYSSDLHRYNAKRKVAELPPVTADVFNDKIAERREKLASVTGAVLAGAGGAVGAAAASASAAERLECKACGKTFSSRNAHDDHLRSRKHREKVMKRVAAIQVSDGSGSSPASTPSVDASGDARAAEGAEAVPSEPSTSKAPATAAGPTEMPTYTPTSCLFCPRSFSSLEVNLKHMSANHAFYIPDAVYCVDVPGLLQHIGEDVLLGNICLWCSHGFGGLVTGSESDRELVKRARRGAEAVRKHMVDKGHCRIPWDTENQRLAYSDYYDFTSSYPAGQGDEEEEEEEDGMDVDAQDWEDEDGSDVDSDDEVVMDYSAIKKKKKTRRPEEEELDYRLAVGEADYELVLPSGTRIGHRALKGVYKQNVMPYVDLNEPKDKLSRLLANTQAREMRKDANSSALIPRNGNGPQDMVVARNAGEAKNARKVTQSFKAQKQMQRRMLKIGMIGNSQEHYRDMLLQ